MHIDLNSCFAIIEQQANRLLRGRPVGVAAYDTPRGFVLAASYQAKALGIKLGVTVGDARLLCPGIVIMAPDPAKYRAAHQRFKRVLLAYTSNVRPKSIDEFVIDLAGSPMLRSGLAVEDVGYDIKESIYKGLGEAVTVNIGIGPNRFLAKLAAGLHKPNGLDKIDWRNLEATYAGLDLLDLPGINVRYRRRLMMYGIKTPLDFLQADAHSLHKIVFKSIVGYYWYLRLRGWEIDSQDFVRRSVGHQYALSKHTSDKAELARMLMKLCEKVGRRIRKSGWSAGGVRLYLDFAYAPPSDHGSSSFNGSSGFMGGDPLSSSRAWHQGQKLNYRLYSTSDIYRVAKRLLDQAIIPGMVRGLSITVFNFEVVEPDQLNLLTAIGESNAADDRRLSQALDKINNRYGEFAVTPATMMNMKTEILDRIAFGAMTDL